MSFGYTQDHKSISAAMHRVMYERNSSILFFAAASKCEANEQEMFPARHKSVLSIRATNTNGCFAGFNPPKSKHDGTALGTLGVNVPCSGMRDSGMDVLKSGTSIATAVAAGTAASLLGYVKGMGMGDEIRKRRGIEAVFRNLAAITLEDHCLYLVPWRLTD